MSLSGCKQKDKLVTTGKKEKVVVYIQPFEKIDEHLLFNLQQRLSQNLNADIKILPTQDFPEGSYYFPKRRYWADSIIYYLQEQSGDKNYYLGVTAKDISTKKDNIANWGVMGLGYQPGNAGVISTYRLGKKNTLNERLYKVAAHELGHNAGLPHCRENGCYMMDAEGKMKLDSEQFFCTKCHQFLINKSFLK
jgi:archaemetzincin